MKQQALLASEEQLENIGDALDYYETPKWCWDAVAPIVRAKLDRTWRPFLIEPGAGRGALLGYALDSIDVHNALAVELDPGRCEELTAAYGDRAHIMGGDFLKSVNKRPDPERRTLIVMNPPYSKPRKTIGQEFVEHALDLAAPDGMVVALLPLAFAASKGRAALHERYAASLYVLSDRPGFGGEYSSGSRDYAWFVWDLAWPKREWKVLVRS